MSNIHITGGNGFIGSNLFKSINKNSNVSRSDINTANILHPNEISEFFKGQEFDTIVHVAGLMGATDSKTKTYEYFSVNATGVLNVLNACKENNIKKFVFLSSLTVHGQNGTNEKFKTESSPFNPLHPYATSKVISEYYIREYCKLNNISAVILRPSIVVGNLEGEPNAVTEFSKNIHKNEPIVLYGDGSHAREYISIENLVKAIEKSIEYLNLKDKEKILEEFIISSGVPISMMDLASLSVKLLKKGEIKKINPNSRSFSLTSSIQKAKKILKWEPSDTIDKLIVDTFSHIENGAKDDH